MHMTILMGRTPAVVGIAHHALVWKQITGVRVEILCTIVCSRLIARSKRNGAVEIVELRQAHILNTQHVLLPTGHIVPPAYSVGDGIGTELLQIVAAHVKHDALALHLKHIGRSKIGHHVYPVGIVMLLLIPETIDNTLLHMNLKCGIVGNEHIALQRGIADILDKEI